MKVKIVNPINADINEQEIQQWILTITAELKSRNIPLKPKADAGLKTVAKSLKLGCAPQASKNPAHITLAFINKKNMQKLNHQFRKKNSATDILSFAPVEQDSLGELALCLSVVYQNTPKAWSHKKWLYYLILHGLLHLLGFEHDADDAHKKDGKMYQLQDSVFQKLLLNTNFFMHQDGSGALLNEKVKKHHPIKFAIITGG